MHGMVTAVQDKAQDDKRPIKRVGPIMVGTVIFTKSRVQDSTCPPNTPIFLSNFHVYKPSSSIPDPPILRWASSSRTRLS